MRIPHSIIAAILLLTTVAFAQQTNPLPGPNELKPLPPPGINVPLDQQYELIAAIDALDKDIKDCRQALAGQPALLALLPDVEIFHNAIRYAHQYREFFKPEEISAALRLAQQGRERAKALRGGKAPWTTETGLVVRGYVSRIDNSIQPYGLVVPPSYRPDAARQYRLDVWLHGRGDTLSETNFLSDRLKNAGQFTAADTIVLHPYGRYNNAFKFAGEIDVMEAMAAVKRHYAIDDNRVAIRGFSMGGAGTWHLAAHYGPLWAAAAPGAGFAETREYIKLTPADIAQVPWYEQKLWHLYDATDSALNFYNLPLVAYSGEKDRQIQAAQVMERELKKEGIELAHIIGPDTEHKYHPDARDEIARRIDGIVAVGRDPFPASIRFTTWTLRYHQASWVTIDALDQHWERASIAADIKADKNVGENKTISVKTQNINALTLRFPAGHSPFAITARPAILIDGQQIEGPASLSDRSWTARLRKTDGKWAMANVADSELRKRHGLQGPIDDAFMDSFLMVKPTGKAANEKTGAWIDGEMKRAINEWRKLFRGEALVKEDRAITNDDIARYNLVLWGDPASNQILGRIADKLPIRWNAQTIQAGAQSFPAAQHVLLMIYPNPLNPKRYVVLNSGFTFREADHMTNSRQTPKLPDYAIVDINTPPTPRSVGRVPLGGFFGEWWEMK